MNIDLTVWWTYSVACLAHYLGLEKKPEAPTTPESLKHGAVFVTLKKDNRLRGCIGTLEAYRPLVEDVASNSYAAAFRDPRFPPLTPAQWEGLYLEISLLSPSVILDVPPDERANHIVNLKPGVILEQKGKRATFLPQVWEELPDPIDFLERISRKAGLPATAWKEADTRLWTYTVASYGDAVSNR